MLECPSTKEVLFRRHFVSDQLCPMCLIGHEITWHMVWACPDSVVVWQECSRRIQKVSSVEDDGISWFTQIRERLSGDDLIEAVTVARLLWLRRNACVFGREVTFPFHVVQSALEVVVSFKLAAIQEHRPYRQAEPGTKKWEHKTIGFLKMNWDATLYPSTKTMGTGAVLWDEHGVVLAALASITPYIRDPTVAEAIALWKAVKLCVDLGCQQVVFEWDSMQVVQTLCNAQGWSRYAQLLEDVRTML
jgi:hypothetical protein